MSNGISIHIGLNRVDPDAYAGWNGVLGGCVNDASAMEAIAARQGFDTTVLLNEQATSEAVLDALAAAAGRLGSDDILVLTYAGHGGQLRDVSSDEPEGLDETWCLYDREMLDDELAVQWTQLAGGVRVLVVSDSCHSGTITRAPLYEQIGRMNLIRSFGVPSAPVLRGIPDDVQQKVLAKHSALYRELRRRTERVARSAIGACVLLISGCQDNQQAMDGANNGLFTEQLLKVWNGGTFSGDHAEFRRRIAALLPPIQSPNYFLTGAANPAFEAQVPFTVASPTASPVPRLSVRAPRTADRADAPPSFEVTSPYRYCVLEIASSGELFDWDGHGGARNATNFYATWDDPAMGRFDEREFLLPEHAWEQLREAQRLYYRVGSTSSATGWDDYIVSTADDRGADAPFIELTG